MATYNKFNDFAEQVGNKLIDLNVDTLKIYLTNTLPVATNTIFGTPAEITAKNGYVAGGIDTVNTWSENPAGTGELVCQDQVWTASTVTDGTGIGPFQYIVLYDNDSTSKHLIGWWDYGSAITLADTETFTADFAANTLTIV